MRKQLMLLRAMMSERGMAAYLVPTADYHESEYVGDYFKCRYFLTGFSGSAGTAIVTQQEAGLWTDGRYFVQAENELMDSGITLYKAGQEGVPTQEEFLKKNLPENGVLGFDGRVLNALTGEMLNEILSHKSVSLSYEDDLIGMIWKERPALPQNPVWLLEDCYAGKSSKDKIADLRQMMSTKEADVHILTSLDDIAWLLNIRGNDISCNPVVLSYVVITKDELLLFMNEKTLEEPVREYLAGLSVTVKPYDAIYAYVRTIKDSSILLEKGKLNYTIFRSLSSSNKIIDGMNPTVLAKAMKNPIEVENERSAHIKDGVALTKFIYWMKKHIGTDLMTEMSVSKYLESLRKQQEGYIEPSFDVISAYKEHAAMCHYKATPLTDKTLEPMGLYLVDSGGQYYEGTTDVTRTLALGPITKEEREHFTLVAMSMLRLGNAKFLHGCRGLNLDYIAREVLWERGLNFDHGTGHGVGYLLNVHERPNGIRWKVVPERQDSGILEEGMITSDEPGIYIEGSHGIRTENLIVCQKAEKNAFGQFMKFEYLTFVPIDLDAIDIAVMEAKDIIMLNQYHKEVYEKIAPHLTTEEAEWLKEATREL